MVLTAARTVVNHHLSQGPVAQPHSSHTVAEELFGRLRAQWFGKQPQMCKMKSLFT